jgi:tripartite-type tricarboxylate transporter receptor subunit TctC
MAVAALASVTLGAGAAQAQDYPSEPIQLIVPWPAGGGSDTSMRLVADALGKEIGVSVVVVNKPGAGGAAGTRDIASAEPDGYTIGMVGNGVIARQYGNPNANALSDLEPIAFFGPDPGGLTVRADSGMTKVADYVEKAQASPGQLKNGSDQPGGSSYLAIAVYENELGMKVTRVPYEGYALQVQALLSGEVDSVTVPVSEVAQYEKSGDLKILGTSDSKRHFLLPDVPTFQEQGYDIVYGSWRMIVGPKGIPEDRLQILEEALVKAMSAPEFEERARNAGFNINPLGSEETAALVADYDEAVYPVLLEANLVRTRQK